MARTQMYHDTRKHPRFCAEGYQETQDGSSCVILFPAQRQQVLRLLSGDAAPAPPPLLAPPQPLGRAQSSTYGAGASGYSEDDMRRWKTAAAAATEALNLGRRLLSEEP